MTTEAGVRRCDVLAALVLSAVRVACTLAVLWNLARPTPALAAEAGEDPAVVGQWDFPLRWPAVAVHLIMMPSGKVLFYRGEGETPTAYTWDPLTEQIDEPLYPGDNIFCSAHSFLPDGRVLVTGGDTGSTGLRNQTLIFDPLTSQWSRGPSMRQGRYYPTTVSTGDGRVLVFSGKDEEPAKDIVEIVEVYVESDGPGSGRWDLLPGADRRMNYYPRMQLLPSGLIFHLGESPITEVFDPATAAWSIIGSTNYTKRFQGTAVMLPPGQERFLIAGGGEKGGPPTATAEIIDLSEASPAWRYTTPMHFPRGDLNAVVLPDATVMVAGGTDDGTPVYPAEIFDPVTETWRLVAPLATKRGYHSTAVLLPDGRVLWAGANGNPTREVYSPSYLFRGARPVIDSTPSLVEYGDTFTVETPDALRVASVVFIRPGAATHAANMEQRYVSLPFVATGAGTLQVVAPTNPNVAPPGYYMLFIVDADGIPSTAPFVLLGDSDSVPRFPSTPISTTTTTISTTTTTTLPQAVCRKGSRRCTIEGIIEADATVYAGDPDTNFGDGTELWADAEVAKMSFLRIRITGVGTGTILKARLRLHTSSAQNAESDSGGRLHTLSDCTWDEGSLTWATRPTIDGTLVATHRAVDEDATVNFNITAALKRDGVYCFALDSLSENGVIYLSREASIGAPELRIAYRRRNKRRR